MISGDAGLRKEERQGGVKVDVSCRLLTLIPRMNTANEYREKINKNIFYDLFWGRLWYFMAIID